MPKDTFYFSHDFNARNDRKLISLRMSFGIESIGVYWCIVEMLFEEDGYMMRTDCERIAFELRTDISTIENVVNSTLFDKDEEKFWSNSVLRRLQLRKEKSLKNKTSAEIRWENERNANALHTQSERNARKEKERKEKKIVGISFLENCQKVEMSDGTIQELGEKQKEFISSGDFKPENIYKGSIY